MPDYGYLRELCMKGTELSAVLVDDYLINFAARRDKADQEFDLRVSRFKSETRDLPSGWLDSFRAQYIGHRIFKRDGLVGKYLGRSEIKALSLELRKYLELLAANIWRFSFSRIVEIPAKDFYEMEDVFSGESFLLFSPSISEILAGYQVMLWLNLVGFNGSCWQSYGPVTSFGGFGADDIFFYATELNPSIQSEDDLLADMEQNPVPYMMLFTGSEFPLVFHQHHEMVQVTGEGYWSGFDIQALKKVFRVEYAGNVFKLSHEKWSSFPHCAEVFYVEADESVLLSALTDEGYNQMIELLAPFDVDVSADPDVRLHLPMLIVLKKLLKKDRELNPYARLFEKKPVPGNR